MSYGESAWSDDEEADHVGELQGEEPDEVELREGYVSEARRFFKASAANRLAKAVPRGEAEGAA